MAADALMIKFRSFIWRKTTQEPSWLSGSCSRNVKMKRHTALDTNLFLVRCMNNQEHYTSGRSRVNRRRLAAEQSPTGVSVPPQHRHRCNSLHQQRCFYISITLSCIHMHRVLSAFFEHEANEPVPRGCWVRQSSSLNNSGRSFLGRLDAETSWFAREEPQRPPRPGTAPSSGALQGS